jgi:hypothetical protein
MVAKRQLPRITSGFVCTWPGVDDLEVVAIKGLLILVLLAGGLPVLADARDVPDRDPAASGSTGEAVNPFGASSDEELTALAARWDTLDLHERRALLTEMKLRMARRGTPAGDVIHIRTERRYGRIIQQPDGRVIRIETQVVEVRPVGEDDLQDDGGFGVGFERRVRTPDVLPVTTEQHPPGGPRPGDASVPGGVQEHPEVPAVQRLP